MQERTKQSETDIVAGVHREDTNILDLNRSLSKSSSHRISMHRSTSHGSSRPSFTLSYGVPGFVDIQEGQTGDNVDENDEQVLNKRKRVSLTRLARLNKPEWPYLLMGSIGAGVNGVIFPVFGLLLSIAIKIFYEPPHVLNRDSKFWALMMVVLAACAFMALPIQNYFFGIAGGKLIQRIRSLTFKKVVHQEIKWFDDPANSRFAILSTS